MVGGLVGATLCGWVYVATLWVAEEYRRLGIGKKLMSLAEDEGRRRGCHHVGLETSQAQAPDFYFKLEYSTFGVLDDYPKGVKLYFFQKALYGRQTDGSMNFRRREGSIFERSLTQPRRA